MKLDKESQGKGIRLSRFRALFHSIMKQSQGPDDQELFDIVMSYINHNRVDTEEKKSSDMDGTSLIDFDRLTTLIEAFQFYPMIVKRDRNKS